MMEAKKEIEKSIKEELYLLERCGLSLANPEKYKQFKTEFTCLLDEMAHLETELKVEGFTPNQNTFYAIKWKYAKLSTNFAFYMDIAGGKKEVIKFQIEKIKSEIESLLSKINQTNFEKIEMELKEYLESAKKRGIHYLDFPEVEKTIIKAQYQIYKLGIKENIINDQMDVKSFLPLLLEEIKIYLQKETLPKNIKEKFEKYLLDTRLIEENINSIIRLFNLLEKENLKENEIEKVLNQPLYKKTDLIPPTSAEIEANKMHYNELAGNRAYSNWNYKEAIKKDPKQCLNLLIENNSGMPLFTILCELKKEFPEYSVEIDVSVIRHIDRLSMDFLEKYCIETNNTFILKYILKNKEKEFSIFHLDIFKKEWQEFINNNPENVEVIINYALECENYGYELCLCRLLKDKKKQAHIILNHKNKKVKEALLEIVDSQIDLFLNSKQGNEILGIFHGTCENKEYKEYVSEETLEKIPFNPLEAYFYSKCLTKESAIGLFVEKYHNCKLDWEYLLKQAVNSGDRKEVLNYLYLENKELFLKLKMSGKMVLSSLEAFTLIENIPNSIVDVFEFLSEEEIIKLSGQSLDIFCKEYEKNLEKSKKTSKEEMLEVATTKSSGKTKQFLTYIMHRGLINEEIINHFKGNDKLLIKEAIKKSKEKYLRPAFLVASGIELTERDYTFLFINEKEMQELKEEYKEKEEMFNLKMKKYYGDLLKIIESVPKTLRLEIVVQIAKSEITEYVLYLESKHPEWGSILLENCTNQNLYEALLSKSNEFLLKESNPDNIAFQTSTPML